MWMRDWVSGPHGYDDAVFFGEGTPKTPRAPQGSRASQGSQGSRIWSLSLFALISTTIELLSSGGAKNCSFPPMNFSEGTSGAGAGGAKRNRFPSDAVNSSGVGLNERDPANANAVVISGLAMKFIVVLWPSFLAGKFLL